MSVLIELLAFAAEREPWQQDMIRRLYVQATLPPQDEEDAFKMLQAWHGLIARDAAPTPVPLTADSDAHCTPRVEGTIINSLGSIHNCGQLASDQVLHFAVDGITVIYGDNGCGKSSYCRMLKKVCRV